MNTKVSLIAAIFLAGCTQMPQLADTPRPAPRPPELFNYFEQEPEETAPFGRFCQLGTSCMTLDSRPFEVCLVGSGSKRCGDKLAEPLLVDQVVVIPAPR